MLSGHLLYYHVIPVRPMSSLYDDNRLRCGVPSPGAVKLASILPWERDADIAFSSAHFGKLKLQKDDWTWQGLRWSLGMVICGPSGRVYGIENVPRRLLPP